MKHGERGAALIETALTLPLLLAAVYGVTWGIRTGVVNERAESAVRFAGVVATQQNPYNDYSLFSLYNNLGTTDKVTTPACMPPTTLYLKGGTLPVVIPGTQTQEQDITPKFWEPDSVTQAYCQNTPARIAFTGTRNYVLLQSTPTLGTAVSDGGYFGDSSLASTLLTNDKFYRSPDLSTLMHCAATLNKVVSSSLAPIKYGTVVARVVPLQTSDFTSAALAVTDNCTTGIGTPPVYPTPVPVALPTGAVPTASPGPGSSPNPTPSPSKTTTPVTPAPSATPTVGASAKPSTGPTGGGGGGGGGQPTASPGPGKGGSPTPVGSPPAKPGPPTSAPVTPSPSKSPSPTPSVTPSPTATPKPVPSPTNSGPPGSQQ